MNGILSGKSEPAPLRLALIMPTMDSPAFNWVKPFGLAYLKSFFIKSSRYEIRQINLAAKVLNELAVNVSSLEPNELNKLEIDETVQQYIQEYISEGKSQTLLETEKSAYDSVWRYLESKNP